MKNHKIKLLFIWPPSFQYLDLPLGIPSLVSYIKNNSNTDINVFDLNIAHFKNNTILYYLFKLNKKYLRITKNIRKKLLYSKKDYKVKQIIKKILGLLIPLPNRYLTYTFNYIKNKEKRFLPWSLKEILNSVYEKKYLKIVNKINNIIKPIIVNNKYNIIGLSVIYPEQLFFSLLIAKIIKDKIDNNILVVFGGSQITKHIAQLKESKNNISLIDFLVSGDGEKPLMDLLNNTSQNNFLKTPNLYIKSNNSFYKNSENQFFIHPDDFTVPDFTGFDMNIYKNYIPICASKGCYWSKCNFCTYASANKKKFNITKISKVIDSIKYLNIEKGFTNFVFVDDALPPNFMKNLAESLINNKINIKWDSSIIINRTFANPNFTKLLKNSGLKKVSVGLESITPRILKLMNKYHKDLDKSEIVNILKCIKNAGINIGLHIILGFPSESKNEAQNTLEFLINYKKYYDFCSIQPFCLEENTPIFLNPKKFGINKIYYKDKNQGKRLGYKYDISSGMSQDQVLIFTHKNAFKVLSKAKIDFKL